MNRTFENKFVDKLQKLKPLFIWVYLFYPKATATPLAYLLYSFFPQKILRINGNVPWPVHFTSKILNSRKIKVGNNSSPGLSNGCYIQAKNGIEIGSNLRMGPNVGLISANHDINNYDLWVKTDPITIGDNVWIGMGVVILPGVKIGHNTIIAANSVVTKNIPSNVVAGGIPCRVFKSKPPYEGKDYRQI
jgi:acetyltransferase-like isoleucine patch superfamily enzyme